MTWTVDLVDVLFFRIDQIGKMAAISFNMANTTIGGVVDVALNITLPASRIGVFANKGGFNGQAPLFLTGTSGNVIGWINPGDSDRVLSFRMPGLGNWALSANTQHFSGCVFTPLA